MKIKFLLSLTIIFLSGCTIGTIGVDQSDSLPASESSRGPAFSKYQNSTGETAKIVVVRDIGFIGMGSGSNFFINGELVAKIHAGKSVTLYMTPTEYQLGIYHGFFPSPEKVKEQSLTVMAGETYYYRIRGAIVEGMVLERTALI